MSTSDQRLDSKWHQATCVGIVVAALVYVSQMNDIAVNTWICTNPVPGVPWINLAAILGCVSSAIFILRSLLPFAVNLITTAMVCMFTAYVAFMCVMGIMGPPDTKEQVMQLVNTLARLPVQWLNPPAARRWMF